MKKAKQKGAARPAGRGASARPAAARTSSFPVRPTMRPQVARSVAGPPVKGKANLITCVVQRGRANDVAKAAMQAGASGATVFTARGMGVGEIVGALGFPIVPQKEVIMIVASDKMTGKIFDVVRRTAELDTIGMGIGYVLPIGQAAGLFEAKTELAG
ncbi:MAG TPA: P-II family nitrogen regulator [Vicinamibacteria bacterium]|nr:P-II family nitrogen regulator [Vicinamibacteria bacterium]